MGCLSRISNFLVTTDFLGKQFELKPNANQKNGTPLGGLLTWLILIFIFLFTVGKYLKQTFQNLNQYSGEVELIDSGDIHINASNNILQFYLMKQTDSGASYVGLQNVTSEFNVQVELVTKKKLETGYNLIKQNYQLIECNNFQDNLETNLSAAQLYCVKGDYNLSSIYNNYQESDISILFSNINPQKNNISNYFMRLIILQSQITQDSKKSVSNLDKLIYIPYIYEYQFGTSMIKNVDIGLSREEGMLSNLFGDSDYKIQQNGYQVKFEHIDTKPYIEMADDQPNFVLKFKNEGSQRIMLLNSQSLVITMCLNLANFGGLLVSLLGIIGIFYGVYQKHKIIVSLMKNTFYFDFQEHSSNQINARTKELENHIVSINGTHQQNLGSNLGKQIDYSFYQFVWMKAQETCQAVADLFGLEYQIEDKNEKMRIYRMAQQKIEQDLDITHILKRLYDIDKLKLLLLDEQQIQLFNTLAKPVIKIQRKKSLRLQRQNRQGTVNSQMLRVSQFFQSGATIHDPKQLLYIYQNIKENQNRNINMNPNILQLVKEHDLVQNILNKEETLQKVKLKLFQPIKGRNQEQDMNKSCESDVNKKYLQERALKIQQLTQQSHKSISHRDIQTPNNQRSRQDLKNLISLKNLQSGIQIYQNKQNDTFKIQSLNNIQSPQFNKKLNIQSQFSVNQQSFLQFQQSVEEFNNNKNGLQRGSIYPNKLKLWSHKQSPFLAYKDKQDQIEEDNTQNQIIESSNENYLKIQSMNSVQLNQEKCDQFDASSIQKSQISFLLRNSISSKSDQESFGEYQQSNNIISKIESKIKESLQNNVNKHRINKNKPNSSYEETQNFSQYIQNEQK